MAIAQVWLALNWILPLASVAQLFGAPSYAWSPVLFPVKEHTQVVVRFPVDRTADWYFPLPLPSWLSLKNKTEQKTLKHILEWELNQILLQTTEWDCSVQDVCLWSS